MAGRAKLRHGGIWEGACSGWQWLSQRETAQHCLFPSQRTNWMPPLAVGSTYPCHVDRYGGATAVLDADPQATYLVLSVATALVMLLALVLAVASMCGLLGGGGGDARLSDRVPPDEEPEGFSDDSAAASDGMEPTINGGGSAVHKNGVDSAWYHVAHPDYDRVVGTVLSEPFDVAAAVRVEASPNGDDARPIKRVPSWRSALHGLRSCRDRSQSGPPTPRSLPCSPRSPRSSSSSCAIDSPSAGRRDRRPSLSEVMNLGMAKDMI